MTGETRIHFRAGDIELEGRLALPTGAAGGCVVCHPHPLYGGNMDNNVVVAVTDALASAGVATLRFNFRGVGASGGAHAGGIGELDDVRAAVDALAAAGGFAKIAVVGYSFGSVVALGFARKEATAEATLLGSVAAVAPPLGMFDASFATRLPFPLLLVAGDRDSYCAKRDFEALVADLGPNASSLLLEGADHFFGGREGEVGRAVARFLKGR